MVFSRNRTSVVARPYFVPVNTANCWAHFSSAALVKSSDRKYFLPARARRKNRWLAEKSVDLEHAQALAADNLQLQTSFENLWTFCKREHRTARNIVDFHPVRTATCHRECGLSKIKYVANVILVLSLSLSVILCVVISFVRWCRVHFVPSGSTYLVYLQYSSAADIGVQMT